MGRKIPLQIFLLAISDYIPLTGVQKKKVRGSSTKY